MKSKNGNDLIRRDPIQRVRRNCHVCQTLFKGKATICEGCRHQRCKRCPREPPNLEKYPDGYPGDAPEMYPLAERVLKQIRHRVRWTCHECQEVFMDGENVCRGCKHERCKLCTREPPKKVKKEPDPEVVKKLEERMEQMKLSAGA